MTFRPFRRPSLTRFPSPDRRPSLLGSPSPVYTLHPVHTIVTNGEIFIASDFCLIQSRPAVENQKINTEPF